MTGYGNGLASSAVPLRCTQLVRVHVWYLRTTNMHAHPSYTRYAGRQAQICMPVSYKFEIISI